jgi:hypothetical protein
MKYYSDILSNDSVIDHSDDGIDDRCIRDVDGG